MIKANDIQLLSVLLNKCVWAKKGYLKPSQKTLLSWYNNASRRDICIRTLNYMLRRLENGFYLRRQQRQWKDKAHRFWYRSTMYFWTPRGVIELERFGVVVRRVLTGFSGFLNGVKTKPLSEKTLKGPDRGSQETLARIKGMTDMIKTI